jgi:hypothetical protein
VSNTYIVGQLVGLSDIITRTATGAITSDSSTIVTVYKPDGTTATPAITHPGVDDPNAYESQITVDQAGWWEYVFSSTSTAAGKGRGRFYVSPVP